MKIGSIIIKVQNPANNKRQFFVSSKKLYNLLDPESTYKTFVETNIVWSRLRENIDYHYNERFETYNLSISSVQAILILENTERSWQFFNELSDLINSGFKTV
ncbi:hypothetical protein 2F1_11 [Uncultured Caudovirales phage clone 2F_1]|uniref:Uncharacterized protein n=1 Tax=Uncultured Caudovirales phage clone 2F_1 TaxID=2992576 RepID=A0A2H4J8M9_9CAUD|nr:hypothetical protein [Acinetobacter radioresistens]YP_010092439.1 hypothetical protein KNT73_gp11 [Uncultured Caudovirales phage clone 2F_1]ASN71612.1 hypothetical protein 2F1_11 [Uncultured Caudovirales phage clone 2F_1]RJL74409.1 hypothetical protein D5055_02730 [Acinetobacter radioresistens]